MRVLLICTLLPLFGCTRIYLYEPISGGEIVEMEDKYRKIRGLSTSIGDLKIIMGGYMAYGQDPRFIIDLKNTSSEPLKFDWQNIIVSHSKTKNHDENAECSNLADGKNCENDLRGKDQRQYSLRFKRKKIYPTDREEFKPHQIEVIIPVRGGKNKALTFELKD